MVVIGLQAIPDDADARIVLPNGPVFFVVVVVVGHNGALAPCRGEVEPSDIRDISDRKVRATPFAPSPS